MYTKRSVVEVIGRSELHMSSVIVGGSWGKVGLPVGWGVPTDEGGSRLLSMSAAVAMSQLSVVTDLGDVWRPTTFHSSRAALKPIIFALQPTRKLAHEPQLFLSQA